MTVFSGKQVVPVDYEAETEVSQKLLEACNSCNDAALALECMGDPSVDVNYVGGVSLKVKTTEVVLKDELPCEVHVQYEEFKTDVTPLFLAVHYGNVSLVRNLLRLGADVNQKLFRGFVTTAAVREGHQEILDILIKSGASQPACEEAVLEASCHGQSRLVELLLCSDLIRPHVAVHSLVTACCRGFVDVVNTLLKCGVDMHANDRVLLCSSKPSLHLNVDCNALVAAIVCRQASVIRLLLQAGATTDFKAKVGAWSWDTASGEELRVGAGLADPYPILWCAVEYFEASGEILRMLLKHFSPSTPHFGRTLLHHAILCGSAGAVKVLLAFGANVECTIKTTSATSISPLHMAARLGFATILQHLIDAGCNLESRINSGETALMICAKYKQESSLKVLAVANSDFGLVNSAGQSALSIARSNQWSLGFQQAVLDVIRAGKVPKSSNFSVFCPLLFVARAGNAQALKALIKCLEIDLDYQDDNGFSAVMIAALEGHLEAFRVLVYAGANVKLGVLAEQIQKQDLFEKVMLEFALEKGIRDAGGFYALHCAARRGELEAVKLLATRGYDVNITNGDGYTPLMLAAREGHGTMCMLLIFYGAQCNTKNSRGETALLLARKNNKKGIQNVAECVILDELARKLVLEGAHLIKHTGGGKGTPHWKEVKMVGATGLLRWGKSQRRNVICKETEVGPSVNFRRNRQRKGDYDEQAVFRIVTVKNKEVHFAWEGGHETADLWVRGIKLVTKEAMFGEKQKMVQKS